jgi:amidase
MSVSPQTYIPGTTIEPMRATVAELSAALADGRLTSAALTSFYEDRIRALNPALRAVITVSPSAAADASASDAHRSSGDARPLEGIPVLVKDNVQTTGMPTTAGSLALLSAQPEDAFIVRRLREAGAIILGKANLSEWANFRSTHSTSGWSTVGGQCANPYDLRRNPSGSSSGSAVAVSAGLAPLAVGTETDGSIVAPASACGVVGIKPTAGLVSRHGVVPLSVTQDTAGPMAGTVADAAAMLSVLAGVDPQDPAVDLPSDLANPVDYVSFLDPAALEGARIGIWRAGSGAAGSATAAVLDDAVARLTSLGAVLVDPVELPEVDKIGEPEFAALRNEFKYGINAYLQYLGGDADIPGSLAELIDFNKRNASLVLSRFGQETFEMCEATPGSLTDPEYLEARGEATRLARAALEGPLAAHKLDAILALTSSPAWLTDYVLGDHIVFGTAGPAAVAGCPAIAVPFGFVGGLPVGVTLMGARWSEPRLIALAHSLEASSSPRPLPEIR